MTRGARVDDRRDLFEMTVEPDGAGDVTIERPAGRECGVSGAICTKGEDRRQLTNSPSATVAGPPDEAPAGLTASFEGVPAAHDGESGFRFRVAFSEDIGISYRSLREKASKQARKNPRTAHVADTTLRYQPVELPCPGTAPVALWVVHVREEHPPPDVKRLEWFVLTTPVCDEPRRRRAGPSVARPSLAHRGLLPHPEVGARSRSCSTTRRSGST